MVDPFWGTSMLVIPVNNGVLFQLQVVSNNLMTAVYHSIFLRNLRVCQRHRHWPWQWTRADVVGQRRDCSPPASRVEALVRKSWDRWNLLILGFWPQRHLQPVVCNSLLNHCFSLFWNKWKCHLHLANKRCFTSGWLSTYPAWMQL